ncbi:hypothetical protein F4560_007067 [Saccharothrix ecbatanensis]|uniref:Protein NO VEIN C-terminal domain-containing protein n=1 Tax=Saccharothrix ecbatanensis TaxID=1105145 RepID=A0A7W9M4T6_9PSEU|nr:DUF3883 domain-containing protein [Saccharothrix ecbatanensis]MBB5807299.1 hypothetical protein [Saccharothrix ecbatanensis]
MKRWRMLPRHGFAFGVFLLARAARVKRRREVDEWIDAARAPRSFLSAEVDLAKPVDVLFKLRLAWSAGGGIVVESRLLSLSESADRATLHGIARLLLAADPPLWLRVAVTSAGVAREYIPEEDLVALSWLEPDLDAVLLGARADLTSPFQEPLRKAIGDAAELFVLAALVRAGARPVHVARISDKYGYDIEAQVPVIRRIEVKAAGTTTRGAFHLTRNEFDRSRYHGKEWELIQVVFASSAMLADQLDASHIEDVLKLTHDTLSALIPPDSANFTWNESALIKPPPAAWQPANLQMDVTFTTPGFRNTPSYQEAR